MHQTEVKLRTGVMGEPKASIRPLNDAKAITNGATALAEGFLFFVGVSLVVGEAWRSSRSASKRRDDVDERLERLEEGVAEFQRGVDERGRAEEDMIRRQEDKYVQESSCTLHSLSSPSASSFQKQQAYMTFSSTYVF